MNKNHNDPQELDLTKPRLALYKQKWKKHQDAVYWVDTQLAQRKSIEVLSNKIERNHPLRYTPSLLYPESCSDGNWRSHKRKSIHVTSASSKDLLETRLDERIGFRCCSSVMIGLEFVSPILRLTVGEDLFPLSVQKRPNLCELRVFVCS